MTVYTPIVAATIEQAVAFIEQHIVQEGDVSAQDTAVDLLYTSWDLLDVPGKRQVLLALNERVGPEHRRVFIALMAAHTAGGLTTVEHLLAAQRGA